MKVNNEVKIGIMVTLSIVVLMGMIYKVKDLSFSKKGHLVKVQFKDIQGVNLSSPVMFNGYKMGVVKDIAIKENDDGIKMELTLWLEEKAQLREDSKAYVKNLGLMGEKYISLTSGLKSSAYLSANKIITGEESPDFEKLMEDGQDIAKELKGISKNINERLENNKEVVDEILVSLNIALKNIVDIADNVEQRLDVNKEHIDNIVNNLELTSKNLEEMSRDLKLHPWKIMYKGKDKKSGKKNSDK